jgi:pentatricopeptide repeat protein
MLSCPATLVLASSSVQRRFIAYCDMNPPRPLRLQTLPHPLTSPSLQVRIAGPGPDDHVLSNPQILQALPLITPDVITYTDFIQCLAYHGDFRTAISVFRDMISATKRPRKARRSRYNKDTHPKAEQVHWTQGGNDIDTYNPSIEIYRSLFLGFARHGVVPRSSSLTPDEFFASAPSGKDSLSGRKRGLPRVLRSHGLRFVTLSPSLDVKPDSLAAWTYSNLKTLFNTFLDLPPTPSAKRSSSNSTPSNSTRHLPDKPPIPPNVIYWVLVAFARTTNGNRALMRDAWYQMAEAFGLDCHRSSAGDHRLSATPDSSGPSPGDGSLDSLQQAGADSRWRVPGRLKTLVNWIESDHPILKESTATTLPPWFEHEDGASPG